MRYHLPQHPISVGAGMLHFLYILLWAGWWPACQCDRSLQKTAQPIRCNLPLLLSIMLACEVVLPVSLAPSHIYSHMYGG